MTIGDTHGYRDLDLLKQRRIPLTSLWQATPLSPEWEGKAQRTQASDTNEVPRWDRHRVPYRMRSFSEGFKDGHALGRHSQSNDGESNPSGDNSSDLSCALRGERISVGQHGDLSFSGEISISSQSRRMSPTASGNMSATSNYQQPGVFSAGSPPSGSRSRPVAPLYGQWQYSLGYASELSEGGGSGRVSRASAGATYPGRISEEKPGTHEDG